jgi:UDP-N-acetylmuramyl-tripeptide synthetase
MTLKQTLRSAQVTPVEILGDGELTGITIDSRQCRPGSLFVCMPGMSRESETFLPDAAKNGATAAIVHSREGMELAAKCGLAAVIVPHVGLSFNDTVWKICDAFFDHPTRNMKVVGVTGTNGKTTTAWIVRDLLSALGQRAGYLGTLGFQTPTLERELNNTTPFAVELYNLLAEARDEGANAMAMEVSSHALAQHRADGIEFDSVVFTNLTQDHLDFHGTMEEYAASKLRLFTEFPRQTQKRTRAALNMDDPVGRSWFELLGNAESAPIRFGTSRNSGPLDVAFLPQKVGVSRIEATLGQVDGISQTSFDVSVALGGNYNVQNAASAIAGLVALGYEMEEVASVLSAVRPVPGRFEPVPNAKGIDVIVDYAHTPDALEKLLDSVRELGPRRVITVFGCGGDRDKTKRPKMAQAASEMSDLTIATSDNPRTEDPEEILKEVMTGMAVGKDSVSIADRREAIHYAVQHAAPGDVVVLAGKGHENYQIIGRAKVPMDDRRIALEALAN